MAAILPLTKPARRTKGRSALLLSHAGRPNPFSSKRISFVRRLGCSFIPIREWQMHSPSASPKEGDVIQRTFRPAISRNESRSAWAQSSDMTSHIPQRKTAFRLPLELDVSTRLFFRLHFSLGSFFIG